MDRHVIHCNTMSYFQNKIKCNASSLIITVIINNVLSYLYSVTRHIIHIHKLSVYDNNPRFGKFSILQEDACPPKLFPFDCKFKKLSFHNNQNNVIHFSSDFTHYSLSHSRNGLWNK